MAGGQHLDEPRVGAAEWCDREGLVKEAASWRTSARTRAGLAREFIAGRDYAQLQVELKAVEVSRLMAFARSAGVIADAGFNREPRYDRFPSGRGR